MEGVLKIIFEKRKLSSKRIILTKTMAGTFAINLEVAQNVLTQYKEYLQKADATNDRIYEKCLSLLQSVELAQVQLLLEAIFDASTKREEGRHHDFSVVLTPSLSCLKEEVEASPFHGCLENVTAFESPLPISSLPKIAPAFAGTNQSLRIWFNDEGESEIWGFAREFLDYYGLRIQPLALGELLIDIKALDFPWKRFLLTFAETNIVERSTPIYGLLIPENKSAVGSDEWHLATHRRQRVFGFIVDVINAMSLHGHGGTMLFVPSHAAGAVLYRSIKKAIPLQPKGSYSVVKKKLELEGREHIHSLNSSNKNQSLPWSFDKEAKLLGQFTAVDGVTILTPEFEVLAIGAKIKESEGEGLAQRKIWVQMAYQDAEAKEKKISDIGGTRHQSAANFVYDNRVDGVFAIVASQDGKISIIYWDERNQRLRSFAHAEYSYRGLKYSN